MLDNDDALGDAIALIGGVPLVFLTLGISLSLLVTWGASNNISELAYDAGTMAAQVAEPASGNHAPMIAELHKLVNNISSYYSFPPMNCTVVGYQVLPQATSPDWLAHVTVSCSFPSLFFGQPTITRSANVFISYQHIVVGA